LNIVERKGCVATKMHVYIACSFSQKCYRILLFLKVFIVYWQYL